jgi:hypothetical protein
MHKDIILHTVAGNSMLPLFRHSDLITGTTFNGVPLPGNCYGFHFRGNKLFHRLIALREQLLVFSGDNTSSFEEVQIKDIFFAADTLGSTLYINFMVLIGRFFFLMPNYRNCRRFKPVFARKLDLILNGSHHAAQKTIHKTGDHPV